MAVDLLTVLVCLPSVSHGRAGYGWLPNRRERASGEALSKAEISKAAGSASWVSGNGAGIGWSRGSREKLGNEKLFLPYQVMTVESKYN